MFVIIFHRSGWLGGVGKRQFLMRKWHYIVGTALCVSTLLFVASGFFLVVDGGTPPESVLARPAELRQLLTPVSANGVRVIRLGDALAASASRSAALAVGHAQIRARRS